MMDAEHEEDEFGPPTGDDICRMCNTPVVAEGVECDSCHVWCHYYCHGWPEADVKALPDDAPWTFALCMGQVELDEAPFQDEAEDASLCDEGASS